MTYRVATTVVVTPEFNRMTADEQMSEQLAAYEIVAKNGGEIEAQVVIPAKQELLVIATYPDATSSIKSHLQVQARGAFVLHAEPAYSLEDWMTIQEAARAEASVGV